MQISCKMKNFKFETKIALFEYFWTAIFLKKYEINMSEFVELQSFIKNKKFLDLGITGSFWITWILLGQHLKKTIVIFEIRVFKFAKIPSSMYKKNLWVLGLKCLFGYF